MNEEQNIFGDEEQDNLTIDTSNSNEIIISSYNYSVKCDSNRRLYITENKTGIFKQFDDIPKGLKRREKVDAMMQILDGLEKLHSSETPSDESSLEEE